MPYLRQVDDTGLRWFVQASAGCGPQRVRKTATVTARTPKQASERAQREGYRLERLAQAAWEQRQARAAAGMTLRAYLEGWLAEVARSGKSPATVVQYRQVVQATVPLLGDVPLRDVTPAHLLALEQQWRERGRQRRDPRSSGGPGLGEARILFRRRILRTAMHEAVVRDLVVSNPVDRLGRATREAPSQPRRTLTLDEARAALAALEAPEWQEWRPVWLTALLTGLRIGELRGLSRADVTLPMAGDEAAGGGWLHVRQQITRVAGRDERRAPKGGRERDVPIPPPLAPVLRAHLAGHAHALVFAGPHGGPFSYDRCRRALHAFVASLGMPDLTPHEFRHSAASLCLASGVPLSYVSFLLGHSDTKITARYAHVIGAAQQQAAQRFAAYLTGEMGARAPK